MYKLYLNEELMPVAPSKLDIKIVNKNKTINLISGGEMNILKSPGLSEIDFEVLLPHTKYPFAVYLNGFKPIDYFLNIFKDLKNSCKPFYFQLIRNEFFDFRMQTSLESYDIIENIEEGRDLIVKVKLKQYIKFECRAVSIKREEGIVKLSTEPKKRETKAPPKTHKVIKGDTLWKIAKRHLNAGDKYKVLYDKNRAMLDKRNKGTGNSKYTIYPGQVLKIE